MKEELLVRLSEVVGGNILCRDGIDLELTCPVHGLPTPKITWLRGDKRVGTGGRLKLGILREESSGNYSCVASNIAGEARKTTKLNVKCKLCSLKTIRYSVELGKAATTDDHNYLYENFWAGLFERGLTLTQD